MKNIFRISLIFISLTAVLYSCKDDDDDVTPPSTTETNITLKFEAMNGLDSLVVGDTFMDYADHEVIIELLQYYISRIEIIDANDNEVYLADVAIIDHTFNDNSVTYTVNPGQYKGIKFGVGLDAALNASDPATFPGDHPLSTAQNTYWGWNKYQFFKIEGRVDSSGTSEVFGYHTGLDPNFRELQLDGEFFLNQGSNTIVTIQFDVNDVFTKTDTVDYLNPNERSWHGETATAYIAEILSDNVAGAMKLK